MGICRDMLRMKHPCGLHNKTPSKFLKRLRFWLMVNDKEGITLLQQQKIQSKIKNTVSSLYIFSPGKNKHKDRKQNVIKLSIILFF